MGYDKQLFVENIYELEKLRGLKIKDLEAGCGISVGYISRLRQGERTSLPAPIFCWQSRSSFLFRSTRF